MDWNENQLKEPRLIDIPIAHDQRGNLSVVEGGELVPFDIKRVYYLYDVPGGTTRGGHAHRNLRQLIIAASGSFDVILDDGKKRSKYSLNRSYHGLYIPTMHWREIENFSSGAVCMVLASEHYDESDYIYDYEDFVKRSARFNMRCVISHSTSHITHLHLFFKSCIYAGECSERFLEMVKVFV